MDLEKDDYLSDDELDEHKRKTSIFKTWKEKSGTGKGKSHMKKMTDKNKEKRERDRKVALAKIKKDGGKDCNVCEAFLTIDNFNERKGHSVSGYLSTCISCAGALSTDRKEKKRREMGVTKKETIEREYNSDDELIAKKCTICEIVKEISEFNKKKQLKIDGYANECRLCANEKKRSG